MKYNKTYFYFNFNRMDRRNPFLNLAAFGRLDRQEGDPITADYMELLRAHCDFIRARAKRREQKKTIAPKRLHPFRRKAYASRALD